MGIIPNRQRVLERICLEHGVDTLGDGYTDAYYLSVLMDIATDAFDEGIRHQKAKSKKRRKGGSDGGTEARQ